MQFFSFDFFIFFLAVFFLNWFLKRWPLFWRLFLLFASYLFYSFWDINFVFVLLVITVFNFVSGEIIWRSDKKWILWLTILIDILFLGIYKYYDFFRVSAENFLGFFGIHANLFFFSVIFPVGLSFYILRAISYNVDIFRRDIRPSYSFLDFSLYMAFFPQLLSGPISRPKFFLDQLENGGAKKIIDFHGYCAQILSGLFKKLVVSSYLSVEIVDKVFSVPQNYNSFMAIVAVYAYALVIYCDFSGYSDMATGIAGLLGFESPLNFNHPYRAQNIQDFWRKWHISLSSWFRDYLYIPLGGMKVSNWRLYFNIMVVMIVSGLWHGASFTFLFWGFLHGIASIIYRARQIKIESIAKIELVNRKVIAKSRKIFARVGSWLLTFNFICFAWIFFKAESVSIGLDLVRKILEFDFSGTLEWKWVYFVFLCILFFFIGSGIRDKFLFIQKKLPFFWQILIGAGLFILIIILAPDVVPPFIYFGF